jgi:hypothetical protein
MKGICFKEPLFYKVVKGEKTQTRRIIPEKIVDDYYNYDDWCLSVTPPDIPCEREYEQEYFMKKHKYLIGEIVYLKEPYLYEYDREEKGYKYYYKFSTADILELKVIGVDIKWKNKLFMPESAARYFIKITGVRAERLQDISEEDCIREGIIPSFSLAGGHWHYFIPDKPDEPYHSPIDAYAAFINKINGNGTWEKNPWVWVYDFELINK